MENQKRTSLQFLQMLEKMSEIVRLAVQNLATRNKVWN
ncbi:hypothetical protein AAKU67_003670 [Oxalobacteraceae bacterium GrIS 2.11]